MAAAERRRGRRDNGLDAADWRAIEDLDPRVSEEVLAGLGARGIAGYVQPAVDVDPVTRNATLPDRPHDRLYVDRQRELAARDYLRQVLDAGERRPDGPDEPAPVTDVDATFADIVAGFDRPPDPLADPLADRRPEPLPEPEPAPEPLPKPAGPVDARHLTEPSLLDALDALERHPELAGGPGDALEPDPPEQFVPPPPPPLPRLSRQSVLGALAVLAGLVMVVGRPDVLPMDRSSTMLLGFATMLGGATALIARLRPGTDPDDTHPNDGARV